MSLNSLTLRMFILGGNFITGGVGVGALGERVRGLIDEASKKRSAAFIYPWLCILRHGVFQKWLFTTFFLSFFSCRPSVHPHSHVHVYLLLDITYP